VGNGGRGSWIARLFQQHGGFEIWALADYFPEVVDRCGEALGVPKNRRFSGLSGYRRVIESGVEAVVLQTPPYFFPIHARAAIEAGRHVYMAKPVAIDVPGCMTIARLGQEATQKRLVFHVDFQMPTDPVNQKVAEAVRSGLLGPLARLKTVGVSGGHADPPKEKTIASRLRGLIWDNDICLGGGFIVSFDIHAIDAALWVLGRRPVAAVGRSRLVRPEPHGGDSPDVSSVIFEYEDGLFHDHFSQHLPNRTPGELSASFYTYNAHAVINYWEKSWYEIRGQKRLEENIVNAYEAGAKRNIDTFYRCIMEGNVGNPTVARGVDACLTCILGREASARGERLTMEALLAENRAIQPDLTGLVE
jgi:predicted dehydrogenase